MKFVAFGCLLLLLSPGSMAAASYPSVWVEGNLYQLELAPNHRLVSALGLDDASTAQHYRGSLAHAPDSWVRLSRVAGQWQGLVSLFGEVHLIRGAAGDDALNTQRVARALSLSGEAGRCGARPQASALETTASEGSALSPPRVSAATIEQLCGSTVDGVCLLPELEMVFDARFQADFPADPQGSAASLLNMVEGYYREDLDLAFDSLSMTFPDTELFNSSTDAYVFLGDTGDPSDPDGITEKKNTLAFLQNRQALLHVVTGRVFDGDLAGVAWENVLCNDGGYSSGTSRVLGGDIGLTAIVVAHEIGHNFGAIHDGTGDNTCPSSGFIMEAQIDTGSPPDGFSSCSVSEIRDSIEALSSSGTRYSLTQCFKYPVDVGITEDGANPASIDDSSGGYPELYYDVSYQEAHGSAAGIAVTGSINADDGEFAEVALGGRACNVAADGLGYSCSGDAVAQQLLVRIRVTGEQLRMQHSVAAEGTQVRDMVPDNDAVSTSLPVNATAAPTNLVLTEQDSSVLLQWSDNADNETGYLIQRQQPGDADWLDLADLAADTVSYEDASVETGRLYRYRVRARHSSGLSSPSNVVEGGVDVVTASAPVPSDSDSGGGALWLFIFWLALLPRCRPWSLS